MRIPLYGVLAATFAVALTVSLPIRAFNETIDCDGINKIKQQGLVESNSKVMEELSYLTDVAMEPWPPDSTGGNNGFPRGWTNEKFFMAAVAPQPFAIVGTPTAWTPGTNGLVRPVLDGGECWHLREHEARVVGLHPIRVAPSAGRLRHQGHVT